MTDQAAPSESPQAVLMPSGKGAGDENFPVASLLIARRHRRHVMAFYAFARAGDDIADSPELSAEEKLARLDALESGLEGGAPAPAPAAMLRRSLAETGIGTVHARTLLAAFRLDAVKPRHGSWEELAAYCALSAHPVGRFMLALHGEDEAAAEASDALTAALQVLNHLQDVRADYAALDRIYLPADWMAAEGVAEADLAAPVASPALRRVIDRCLDGCDAWLDGSERLPGRLRSRRLGAETAAIQALARRLARRLRREDPLASRVRTGPADTAHAALAALFRLAGRA